ncbi:hypothetical protein B0H19DRAFT_139594 [Mycena capillaripes]|nr:hypothetical protein B0H19DRAFT_139594 [Mycena capillaripes]
MDLTSLFRVRPLPFLTLPMYFFPGAKILFLLLSGLAAGHELGRPLAQNSGRLTTLDSRSRMDQPLSRRLVPFSNPGRSQRARPAKRALVPKNTLNLAYGLETASFPSTLLRFSADANMPMVSLEDIDHLLEDVLCHKDDVLSVTKITLIFTSGSVHVEALASWFTSPAFMLITFHPTCNRPDQRGAWLITEVAGLAEHQQITLDATSVPLREVGSSLHISHTAEGVSSSWGRSLDITRRDVDRVFSFGHDFNFAVRQQLFPVDQELVQRSTPSRDPLLEASDLGFQVFCVDCVSKTNFSVGIELDITDLGTKIDDAHINITVQQFQHDIQLEFSFNRSLALHQSIDVIKAALPDLGITIPDIGSIGFFYGGTVSADMEISGGLNFSIGAKTSIPAGATATVVMAGDANSSATGWDGADLSFIPFRLNSGSFNASAQLSLSPFLEVEISLLKALSASARIGINTPQMKAQASVISNVNRQCQPIGPTDFESFTSALTFGAGASVDIHASTNGTLHPDISDALFTHNITFGSIPPPAARGALSSQTTIPLHSLLVRWLARSRRRLGHSVRRLRQSRRLILRRSSNSIRSRGCCRRMSTIRSLCRRLQYQRI